MQTRSVSITVDLVTIYEDGMIALVQR